MPENDKYTIIFANEGADLSCHCCDKTFLTNDKILVYKASDDCDLMLCWTCLRTMTNKVRCLPRRKPVKRMVVHCRQCNKEMLAYPSQLRHGQKKYCSRECMQCARKEQKNV